MKMLKIFFLVLLASISAFLLFFRKSTPSQSNLNKDNSKNNLSLLNLTEKIASNNGEIISPDETDFLKNNSTSDERLAQQADGSVHFLPSIESANSVISSDSIKEWTGAVDAVFGHYRFAYKENPVGVYNPEITKQLLGANPMKIVFVSPDSPVIRGNELVDKWGTPYYFHSQSASEMEFISAGEDKELWTADDISSSD